MTEAASQNEPEEKGSSEEPLFIAYKAARVVLPIEVAKPQRKWMDETPYGFANRCLPLRIANQAGWVILNDRRIDVIWRGGPSAADVLINHHKIHPDEDLSQQSLFAMSHFGSGIVTWKIPYVFRTPPGYDLYVRGVTNWIKDGACPLDGIVETEWSIQTFTMNWKLTRPNLMVTFEEGEPICMIFPLRRGDIERFRPEVRPLEDDPELAARVRRWLVERSSFINNLSAAKTAVWQGDYYAGRSFKGEPFPDHRLKLELREFKDGAGKE